ncbi:hypothetical protein [Jeotgalibacillus proteolyticus]|uniref:Uncharacterized protein n=1 Tax=Jeotgalibacillus proteolyticus TaxID=2082395 RepID=A0A2S5GBV9_9BACL|nr:hypothetical protein [Jeotgalibacillus proteolyticus]PPA70479.1 hypothetical protein C4B60_12995 [Jeotgalibacillus proteolyticus]
MAAAVGEESIVDTDQAVKRSAGMAEAAAAGADVTLSLVQTAIKTKDTTPAADYIENNVVKTPLIGCTDQRSLICVF